MTPKKIFLCFLIILSCTFGKAYAQTVEVEAPKLAQSSNQTSIKLLEPLEISNEQILESGVILKGNLTDVVSPKRLKRNAGFSFKPSSYVDLNGNTKAFKSNIKASYTVPIDKKHLAKNAALGVGNHF